MKCPRCDVELKAGKALAASISKFVRICFGTPVGDGTTHTVMKCPECGHSEELDREISR